jgi:CP family cyanate transporter-like MFS transporter
MSNPRPTLPPVWVLSVALVAVAANLRTAIASVPPLTQAIAGDLGLSHTALGALTTLPVLCMGLFAPLAQRIAARLGAAASVELAVGCVAIGVALRFAGGHVWALYAGTFVAGVGIALGGTLLPGLVKELFPPQRSGLVTGLYMLAMMSGAAASSALAVPLQGWLGSWEAALGSWSILAVVGALAWLPVVAGHARHRTANPVPVTSVRLPWGHLTAWLVAAYLTVQSVGFYSTLAWLAPSYTARGWDPTHAGYLLSAFTAAQLVSGLLAPALTDRITDHRLLLLAASLLGAVGQAGLWLGPTVAPWEWAVVLGFGQGASFALGLVLMVDYADSPAASARLAGLAFFVSYTLASFGPATLGALRDATGGFTAVWMTLTLLTIVQLALAVLLRPGLRKVA